MLKPTLAAPVVAGTERVHRGQHHCSVVAWTRRRSNCWRCFPIRTFRRRWPGKGTPGSLDGGSNYQFQYAVPNDTLSYDVRIDHNINAEQPHLRPVQQFHRDRAGPAVDRESDRRATEISRRSITFAESPSRSLGPMSFRRRWSTNFAADSAATMRTAIRIGLTLGTSKAADYGLTGIPSGPNDAGIPPINITGLQRLGTAPWRPQFQIAQVWQLLDTLSWLKGNHSFKFGYEHRHTSDNFLGCQSLQGQITASGIYTGNSGLGVPDFLLGDVSTASFTTPTDCAQLSRRLQLFRAGHLARAARI